MGLSLWGSDHSCAPSLFCTAAEEEIAAIDGEMLRAGSDLDALKDLGARRDALQEQVDAKYVEWDSLEALLGETLPA